MSAAYAFSAKKSPFYRLPYPSLASLVRNLEASCKDSKNSPKKRSEAQWQLLEARHVLKDRMQRVPKDLETDESLLWIGVPVCNRRTNTRWVIVQADFRVLNQVFVHLRWDDDETATPPAITSVRVGLQDLVIDYGRIPKLYF